MTQKGTASNPGRFTPTSVQPVGDAGYTFNYTLDVSAQRIADRNVGASGEVTLFGGEVGAYVRDFTIALGGVTVAPMDAAGQLVPANTYIEPGKSLVVYVSRSLDARPTGAFNLTVAVDAPGAVQGSWPVTWSDTPNTSHNTTAKLSDSFPEFALSDDAKDAGVGADGVVTLSLPASVASAPNWTLVEQFSYTATRGLGGSEVGGDSTVAIPVCEYTSGGTLDQSVFKPYINDAELVWDSSRDDDNKATVKVCTEFQLPTATVTLDGTYGATYGWSIRKDASPDEVIRVIPGVGDWFDFEIIVDAFIDEYTEPTLTASSKFTVTNPNSTPIKVSDITATTVPATGVKVTPPSQDEIAKDGGKADWTIEWEGNGGAEPPTDSITVTVFYGSGTDAKQLATETFTFGTGAFDGVCNEANGCKARLTDVFPELLKAYPALVVTDVDGNEYIELDAEAVIADMAQEEACLEEISDVSLAADEPECGRTDKVSSFTYSAQRGVEVEGSDPAAPESIGAEDDDPVPACAPDEKDGYDSECAYATQTEPPVHG